jgi:hypothetical protein
MGKHHVELRLGDTLKSTILGDESTNRGTFRRQCCNTSCLLGLTSSTFNLSPLDIFSFDNILRGIIRPGYSFCRPETARPRPNNLPRDYRGQVVRGNGFLRCLLCLG